MTQSRRFLPNPASVAAARRFIEQLLDGLDPDVVHTVKLIVSELATNCVRHASTPYCVTATRTEQAIRVEFADGGDGRAHLLSPGPDEPHGRGLQIVSALADEWGVQRRPETPGKVTWFRCSTQRVEASPGQ